MKNKCRAAWLLGFLVPLAGTGISAGAPPRSPTRSPNAPGTPALTRVGTALGANPPANADGDFLISPEYLPAPELTPRPGVPRGTLHRFTMHSGDSKIYAGITKVPPGGPADYMPPDLTKVPTFPKAYTRLITVYVPAHYVPGTPAPVLVKQDGADDALPIALDNLIAQRRVPALVAVMIQNGGGDAQGTSAAWNTTRCPADTRSSSRRRCCRSWNELQREADQGPGRTRRHGRQFRRFGGLDDGLVSPGMVSPGHHLFRHLCEPAVAVQSRRPRTAPGNSTKN